MLNRTPPPNAAIDRKPCGPRVTWEVWNGADGFLHRIVANGIGGEWVGYTTPASLSIPGFTYVIVTNYYCGDPIFPQCGEDGAYYIVAKGQ